MRFSIYQAEAGSILSATSGFITQAGFTHSLSPTRNCTFACTYCYVPPMRIYGSPLIAPYQPAEASASLMPRIIEALIHQPSRVFTLQTRGPLVLRDLPLLLKLAGRTIVRIGFSITTDREDIRRSYEPHCAPMPERLETIRHLRAAGIAVYATLALLLPCDPERLADLTLAATDRDLIGDLFHVRALKKSGATTREATHRISRVRVYDDWRSGVSIRTGGVSPGLRK